MPHPIHTSNPRLFNRLWRSLGGRIVPVRRTGEVFYIHERFCRPVRANARRLDVPAKLLSRLNELLRAS
ncbi:MAG: hypothetical protein K5880_22000 [Hydrogenophaga sp.]|jgi:hypothetical protein|uniref:hypothetical protein n=1 Tax=Hydrogenophaga sp. TaxID=1904254 RepID=UPI002623916A|nr:hypothetical protein [Hydrogenophaga sp.]MCV0441276.1 hypothetical protein [Hydrogenophaga sp.]